MKIYLIRHGETTGDIEDRYGGDYDDELTAKGIEQAKDLAKKFSGKKIKVIYSSPKKRALATAQALAEKTSAKIVVVENLRERNNYGVLSGLTKMEAKEKFPFDVKELEGGGVRHKVKNSETFDRFNERVLGAFKTIVNEGDEDIALVTHAGPIMRILDGLFKKRANSIGMGAWIEIEETRGEYKLGESFGVEFA